MVLADTWALNWLPSHRFELHESTVKLHGALGFAVSVVYLEAAKTFSGNGDQRA